jgi:hypothetical protein
MRFVPRVAVLRRVVRAPAGAAASALGTASAAHGPLEACARLFGNARAHRRLPFARVRRFSGLVRFLVSFSMGFVMNPGVLFSVSFDRLSSVPFRVFGRSFRGQRFVVHFVGDGVGFLGRIHVVSFVVFFVIVFLIAFLIISPITFVIVTVITFVIRVLIGVQRFLQFLEFGGLDIRFGHRFDSFGALFGVSLRFLVLGFGKLFGERGYVFLGKARAIRGRRVS